MTNDSQLLIRLLGAVLIVLSVASPGAARQKPAEAAEPAGEAGQSEDSEEEFKNELALVLAATRERAEDEKETSFTIGIEYERKLSDHLGIVVEAEYVNGPDAWVFAMPLVFRPVGEFKLFTGPGFERGVAHEGEEHELEIPFSDREKVNLFLWRAGTGYSWEFKERYVVGPSIYMDFVSEGDGEWRRAFVFAVAVGVVF